MLLAAFCKTLRSRWQALTQQIWPDSPRQRTQRELARLQTDLARRYRRLLQRRCRIEKVSAHLTEQEKQIVELSRQVPDAAGEQAQDLAAMLGRLQRAARRSRNRLEQHEQAYSHELAALERKKHVRRALLRGDVVVVSSHDAMDEA
jgi:hypothetical protein